MKYYVISEEVLKSVLTYLMQRPYAEVAEGVQVLTQLPELPTQEPGIAETSEADASSLGSVSSVA